jgi:hypothetical protein
MQMRPGMRAFLRWSMTVGSRCCLLATLLWSSEASAEETFTQIDITPTASAMQYHRFGNTRSPGGAALGVGGELRMHWNNLGFALAYTGVPTSATAVDLGKGPATHFADTSVSVIVAETGSRRSFKPRVSGTIEAGPSFAIVDHTYTDGDPATGTMRTRLDVPNHISFGGNVGFVVRVHVPVVVFSFGVGYRGGVPIDVPDAHWEGALAFHVGVGFEWTTWHPEIGREP